MSKRNMIWLAVVVAVGVVAWLAVSIVVGIIAAVVALAVSEFVERRARAERRRSSHDAV